MRRLYVLSVAVAIIAVTVVVGVNLMTLKAQLELIRVEGPIMVKAETWGGNLTSSNRVDRWKDDVRWINFTVQNNGSELVAGPGHLTREELPHFKLFGYDESREDFRSLESGYYELQPGNNTIQILGRKSMSFYQLQLNGQTIWQGPIT